MKTGIITAWMFGMGIITYRYIVRRHQPPVPGALLGASGLFALLALLAEYEPAAGAAALAAWGFDLAALLEVLPQYLAGPKGQYQSAQPVNVTTGTSQAPGTSTAGGRG